MVRSFRKNNCHLSTERVSKVKHRKTLTNLEVSGGRLDRVQFYACRVDR